MKVYDKVILMPMDRIRPYSNNPRHNEATIATLVKMIPEVGFNVPIVVDKNGVIIKGHSRFEAAKQLGMTEIPCIVSELSEAEAAQDRLVDNKLSDLSKWDEEKLRLEMSHIAFDIPELGFTLSRPKVAELEVEQTEVEQAQKKLIDAKEFGSEKREFREVHCHKCGEVFYLDEAEIDRFSKG